MSELQKGSPAMKGAYRKGFEAFRAGKNRNANPYRKHYPCNSRNGGTWGAVFCSYWDQGWAAAKVTDSAEH